MKKISTLTPKIRELLEYSSLQYMFNALSENPKVGQIFVDDESNPNTCIVFWKHSIYIGGRLTQDSLHFLFNELLTEEIKNNLQVCSIFYPNEEWKGALAELYNDHCNQYERSLYSSKPSCIDSPTHSDSIVEISKELMESTVDNLDMITDEIIGTGTYDNMEDFFTRGIGYTIIIDNKVCGFCTSEYPSENELAIGIEVLEEYQKKGYAKAMTKEYLYKAAQRGLHVYWECWKNNIASANTAKSCGFEKVADYPILFLVF